LQANVRALDARAAQEEEILEFADASGDHTTEVPAQTTKRTPITKPVLQAVRSDRALEPKPATAESKTATGFSTVGSPTFRTHGPHHSQKDPSPLRKHVTEDLAAYNSAQSQMNAVENIGRLLEREK
jgi:hypothetical protein